MSTEQARTRAKQNYSIGKKITEDGTVKDVEFYISDLIRSVDKRTMQFIQANQFPIIEDCLEGAFLYGKVGTGKTVNAALRLLNWGIKVFTKNNYAIIDCMFVPVSGVLESIKASYNPNSVERSEDIIARLQVTRMLVLDDLAVGKDTDWAFSILYEIIDYRYRNLIPTIYTSNLSLTELAKLWKDDRITSRIAQDCKGRIKHFTGKSKRL